MEWEIRPFQGCACEPDTKQIRNIRCILFQHYHNNNYNNDDDDDDDN